MAGWLAVGRASDPIPRGAATPYRIAITGHTSAPKTPSRAEYGPWNLSADRANVVRQILEESGLPPANFYAVAGKADTDPLFPDDPFIAANLVIIQLQRGAAGPALIAAQQIPPDIWRDIALAFATQGGNDRAVADEAVKRLIDTSADGSAYQIAEVDGWRKDPDSMFKWLDRAGAIRDSGIGRLLTDPFILRYQDDPRFAAFCKKVRLPILTEAKAMP